MNLLSTIFLYLKLFKIFAQMSLMDQMAYPLNFYLAIAMKTFRIAIVLIFFKAIYLKVNNISGWNFADVLLIFATFSLIDFIMSVTFFRNLIFWFSRRLNKGAFDFDIIRPVNLQFVNAFRTFDFMDLTTIIPITILFWYALSKIEMTLSAVNILLYLILVVNAILFIYSFTLFLATFNFWTIQPTGLGRFAAGITWMARYPIDIFFGAWRIIFSYVFPITFIATWPAKAFLGVLGWQNILYALVFTAVFFWLANRFWNYGLKHYSSASS